MTGSKWHSVRARKKARYSPSLVRSCRLVPKNPFQDFTVCEVRRPGNSESCHRPWRLGILWWLFCKTCLGRSTLLALLTPPAP